MIDVKTIEAFDPFRRHEGKKVWRYSLFHDKWLYTYDVMPWKSVAGFNVKR